MNLRELELGKTAVIIKVGGEGALRQHFLDMGVIPGIEITLVKYAPMGDPMELRIHGYELTLRLADAERIEIQPVLEKPEKEQERTEDTAGGDMADRKNAKNASRKRQETPKSKMEHPGLGEGGRYHVKEGETPLAKGEIRTFALAGNQNCGKTTLFNQLTGSNQHVGNFPGVTVDRKDGQIKKRKTQDF
jgi:ferrous iron transport protein B